MDYSELQNYISTQLPESGSGTLTIASADSLAGATNATVGELLTYCYGDESVTIAIADVSTDVMENDPGQTIVISGTSSFLEVTDMAVTATFFIENIDNNDYVQVELIYTLPDTWNFSDSFPDLPQVTDHAEPVSYYAIAGEDEISIAETTALDQFSFQNPTLVVTTKATDSGQTEAITVATNTTVNAVLQWGINFVSNLQPTGMLLALEHLFNHTDVLPVYGTIRKPLSTETVNNLSTAISGYTPDANTLVPYPWDTNLDAYVAGESNMFLRGIPGILLKTGLGLNYNIGENEGRTGVSFTADSLYSYTPLSDDWVTSDTNPAFVPIQAYTGQLTVSSIQMDMVSAIDVGKDILSLEANFQNLDIDSILDLAGLTDDAQNPAGNLPDTLSDLLDTLETLSLTNAGVSVNYYNELYDPPNVTVVNQMHFTVGFRSLEWQVWEDHIALDSISCSFAYDYPFNSAENSFPWEEPATRIGLTARLTIENVSFTVYGDLYRSDRNYHEFYAEMDDDTPLYLNDIVAKYADGVPVFDSADPNASLAINTFRISIIPDVSYAMAMTVAEAPDAWQISLSGGAQLELQDIAFLLSYVKNDSESSEGVLSGELSGTFTLSNSDPAKDVSFSLAGSVHKDVEGTGWRFTGRSNGSIAMGDLIDSLAAKFNITNSVPQPLSGLTLQNLAMAFDTQSNDFSFSGEADFVVNEQPLALTARVDITHGQDGTTQKSFSGSLTLGTENPRTFSLSFDDAQDTLMLASYSDTSGQADFDVGDLINSMLDSPVAPSELTISLHDAFMAYIHPDTDTDPDATAKFVFSIDVGNGIDLSNLPLVGKLYPKGKTVSLSYQIQYASAVFTSAEVADINALLPVGVHPLLTDQGSGEMPEGLNLAVSMQLGTDIIPFDLDLAASGADDDPDVDTYSTNADGTKAIPDDQDPVVSKNSGQPDPIAWFDIQKNMGPVHFNRIGVAYSSDNGGTLEFALDASFSLGGLEITLDGLSVRSPLTRFEPHFDLDGLGIAYANPAVEIGAAFLKEHIGNSSPDGYDEFDGAALLRTEELSLSAIGSYAYVNGKPSLFIYTALNKPLGGPPFFFVTGISVGFGYNRALIMPSVDKVLEFPLVAEAISGASLPANAGKSTLTEKLEAIHSYVPVSTGNMFLAAGISFTTFKLIDSTILLAASFGNRFELDLLGVSTLVVPPKAGKTPLAVVQMTLKGAFIPDDGFVGLQGQLTSASYILSKDCHLSGGFAFYSWYKWEHKDDFIATIGGYHPDFEKPSHYPDVPRLTFKWKLDSYTQIKGDAYFALCPHALMAGGHLEATYKKGKLKAWYKVGADFLIAWKPYHYEASVHVHIGGSYTYHFFGKHHITIDVGADVKIWGPEFGGHAKIDLSVCSIGVDFGASKVSEPEPIDWTSFNDSFLPDSNLCSVTVNSGLVSKGNEGLLERTAKNTDLTGFTIAYDNKDWTVKSDNSDATYRTIMIGKSEESDKTIVITLADNSVTIDGQIISNPDETIIISSLGIVNPKELVLLTDAFIPSKTITWGDGVTVSQPNIADWNADFGIGPMEVSTSELNCSQTITVERHDGANWADHTSDFTYTVRTKKAPAGLWGTTLKPGVNDARFIDNTFTGLQIVLGEPTPGASHFINQDFVKYEISAIADAIQWETRKAFTAHDFTQEESPEEKAKTDINDSIMSDNSNDDVVETRKTLLNTLGVNATIDLTNTIADDLILAPQVEK